MGQFGELGGPGSGEEVTRERLVGDDVANELFSLLLDATSESVWRDGWARADN